MRGSVEPMKNDPIRLGLIGYGIWGEKILQTLLTLGVRPDVVETSEPRRKAAIAAGARSASDEIAALPAVDGIIVATPATNHCQLVLRLLDQFSCPLFVEKPLTADADEARLIVREGGTRVFVMHIWRYHPGIRALAEIARSGELGSVAGVRTVRTNWTSPRTDVDSLWNLAPHDISIALAVLGFIPEPRFVLAERQGSRICGLIGVCGESPWLALEVSNRYRDKRREVRLHCDGGVAVMTDPDAGFIEITREGDTRIPFDSRTEQRPVSRQSALGLELGSFIDYLGGGPAPPTDAAEGLAVVETLMRLQHMANSGGAS